MNNSKGLTGQCECGKAHFEVVGKPVFRSICHCQFCQQFNQGPFADIMVFRHKDIKLAAQDAVTFESNAKPEMLQRGKCNSCQKPVIEYLNVPLMPGLTIVPSDTLQSDVAMIKPSFHAFYHRRQQDAEDSLPKYSGFVLSQMRFMMHVIKGLLKR